MKSIEHGSVRLQSVFFGSSRKREEPFFDDCRGHPTDGPGNQTVDKGTSTVIFMQKGQKTKRKNEDNVEYIQKQVQAVSEVLRQQREKQQKMNLVIMEQMIPEDHFLRKVDRSVDFSFIYDLCATVLRG